MRDRTYKHMSFRMNDKSWEAVEYLREIRVNMSSLIRKALIKEMERQEKIKKAFPEE